MSKSTDKKKTQSFAQYETLAKHLLEGLIGPENTDTVASISVEETGGKICINVLLPNELKGQVIGKGGRMARALRSIIEIAPFDNRHPTLFNIVD